MSPQPITIDVDVDALVELVAARVLTELQAIPPAKVAYTPATLAAELGITPRTIRAAIDRGDLQAIKRSGRWLIPAEAVTQWTTPPDASGSHAKPIRTSKRSPAQHALSDALQALERSH